MSQCQQQRLSSETTEERQIRLQRDADLHQRTRSIVVIERFHTDLSNLKVSVCSTCYELHHDSTKHSLELFELSNECMY